MAHPGNPYTVQVDIYVARRKRIHSVCDPSGAPVYNDPHLMNVLAWLEDQGVTDALFTDEEDTFVVTFIRHHLSTTPDGSSHNG